MSRFDKRVVVALVVVAATAVQAGLAGLAYYGKGRAEQRIVDAQGQLDMIGARLEMARQASELQVEEVDSKWRLAPEPDVSRTLQIVQEIGDSVGVDLETLEVLKSKTAGKRSFRVAGQAVPDQLCALIATLEGLEELIIVETGRVLPGTDTEIYFDLGLATYHVAQERGQ